MDDSGPHRKRRRLELSSTGSHTALSADTKMDDTVYADPDEEEEACDLSNNSSMNMSVATIDVGEDDKDVEDVTAVADDIDRVFIRRPPGTVTYVGRKKAEAEIASASASASASADTTGPGPVAGAAAAPPLPPIAPPTPPPTATDNT